MGKIDGLESRLSEMSIDVTFIRERLASIEAWAEGVAKDYAGINSKLDQQLHLMHDMVRVEASLKSLEEKIDKNVSSVMDRLIEMAMVRNGDAPSATVHRAQSRIESTPVEAGEWEDKGEERWPPPGCDAMGMKG